MEVQNSVETSAGDAGNIEDTEDSRSEREDEVTETRITVTNRFRGRSTTKFFPWNSRSTIGSFKRKVAREFRLPKGMRFIFTGEAGRRIRNINNGDEIYIKKERGARQLAGKIGAETGAQKHAVQQCTQLAQSTQSTQKSPEERRKAALKMLLSCLEV